MGGRGNGNFGQLKPKPGQRTSWLNRFTIRACLIATLILTTASAAVDDKAPSRELLEFLAEWSSDDEWVDPMALDAVMETNPGTNTNAQNREQVEDDDESVDPDHQ